MKDPDLRMNLLIILCLLIPFLMVILDINLFKICVCSYVYLITIYVIDIWRKL